PFQFSGGRGYFVEVTATAIDVFQCYAPRTFIAAGEIKVVKRLREFWLFAKDVSQCDDKETFANLRYTEIGSVQDRIARPVSRLFEPLADFFRDVVSAEIKNVRDIFYENDE